MPGSGHLGPPKARLCHFFDNRGHRISLHGEYGCPRSASSCHFVHPSDPEWETIVRRETRRFSDDHSARPSPASPSRGRERRRSTSFDRVPTSPRRGTVRIRTPVRRQPSSRSPRRDDPPHDRDVRHGPPRHEPSHERPTLIERIDRKPAHVIPQPSKPPTQPSMSHTNIRGSSDRDFKSSSVKGTATATPSGATTSALPSEIATKPSGPVAVPLRRPFSEALPPPPLQNLSPPGDDTMSPEQRRAVWDKRIALMADATKEFMELEKLEQDVQLRRHQVQTSAFTTLPSDIRTTFQTGLANAESAYEKKKDSYNSIINRLSETTFWPAVPSQRVGELETKLKEAKTMLGGLADGVGQLYKKIEGLYEERGGGTTAKRSGMNEDLAAGSGDGAVHTKKRRRLSINGSDDATPSDIRENVESIKSTIREIEDHLHEVENDISQHSCHIMELLEVKMEEKIEDIARNTDISSLVEVRLGPQTVKTIQAFSESFAHADREIGELAQEVAELIPKLDSLKHDNDLFKQEEAANKELLAELTKADQENTEALARLQSEAKLLQSAFAAHSTRGIRPPLPLLPSSPLPKPFMDAIEGTIQKQVHEQILPIFAEARLNTERTAQARDIELYEKLVSYKSGQTSKLPQLISAWLERHPDYLSQALAVAAASAKSSGSGGSSRVST